MVSSRRVELPIILHNVAQFPLVHIAIIIPHKPFARSLARSKASFLSFKFTGIARLARCFVTRERTNRDDDWWIGWSFGESVVVVVRSDDSRSQLIERREWSGLSSRSESAPAVAFIFRSEMIRLSSPLRGPFRVDKEPLYSRYAITMRSNVAPVKMYPHRSLHDIVDACGKHFSNSLSLATYREQY